MKRRPYHIEIKISKEDVINALNLLGYDISQDYRISNIEYNTNYTDQAEIILIDEALRDN
jgi:hypothetical protein